MKKKLVSIMLMMIMIFTTACGNKSNEKDAKTQSSTKTKIEYWFGLGSEAGKLMKNIVEDFNKSQDKYEVVPITQGNYSETYQKFQAAVASKTEPGVMITTTAMLSDLANKGALTEFDKSDIEDDFLDTFLKSMKVKDKIYGIPAYGTTQVSYFRKDLMEKANINPNEAYKSWENLIKASKEIKNKKITKYGHLPMWGPDNLIDIATSAGGNILSNDGKKVTINSKEWVNSWEMIRKAIHDDKIMKVNSGGQGWEYWYKTIDNVMKGEAMGYTGSSGDKGNLDFSKIGSLQQPGFNDQKCRVGVGTLSFAIPKNIKKEQKEAAKAWIKFFTKPENIAKWSKNIGYIPVREKAISVPEYKEFAEKNSYINIPYEQAKNGIPEFVDPTGNKIMDSLKKAADKIELENIPAQKALDEAQKEAQKSLDEIYKK